MLDINRIRYLREILVTDTKGKRTVVLEFSYDSPPHRVPHFFGVPDNDMPQAHALYAAWGGSRPEGYRIGTTVSRPQSVPHG